MTYASKTPEQQKNFRSLLNGMVEMYGDKRSDSHFMMDCFQSRRGLIRKRIKVIRAFTKHSKRTTACLLGHGPVFGVVNNEILVCWDNYGMQFFGVEVKFYRSEWDFVFSSEWSNDIQEAIARLRMYINGFDPGAENWHYSDRYAGGEQFESLRLNGKIGQQVCDGATAGGFGTNER